MATPRKVRFQKKLFRVLTQLFTDFPDLQWFRNIHDGQAHLDWTTDYIAGWSNLNGSFHFYYLTKKLNGPILYHGRDLDGRPWAFASNAMTSLDTSVSWLVGVEEQDTYMVAVLNTLLNMEGLMPVEETKLFLSSMGFSNSEEPGREVVEWLKSHMDKMPARLQDSCDRARLYRR